jgi:hypothetical protein
LIFNLYLFMSSFCASDQDIYSTWCLPNIMTSCWHICHYKGKNISVSFSFTQISTSWHVSCFTKYINTSSTTMDKRRNWVIKVSFEIPTENTRQLNSKETELLELKPMYKECKLSIVDFKLKKNGIIIKIPMWTILSLTDPVCKTLFHC